MGNLQRFKDWMNDEKRNDAFIDSWSGVHFLTGVCMAWVMDPLWALIILVLWEPLEVLVLSPLFDRFGIEFGFESVKNSMSDIVFDVAGVAAGYYGLRALVDPPFVLF